jgi:parallel beta-helix repeat protein
MNPLFKFLGTVLSVFFFFSFSTNNFSQTFNYYATEVFPTWDNSYVVLTRGLSFDTPHVVKKLRDSNFEDSGLEEVWSRNVGSAIGFGRYFVSNGFAETFNHYLISSSDKILAINKSNGGVSRIIEDKEGFRVNTYFNNLATSNTGSTQIVVEEDRLENNRYESYLTKYNWDGISLTRLYSKKPNWSYDQSQNITRNIIQKILPHPDGGYYIVGSTEEFFFSPSLNNEGHLLVAKVDENFTIQWEYYHKLEGRNYGNVSDAKLDSKGNLYIMASSEWMMAVDQFGNVIHQPTSINFLDFDIFYSVFPKFTITCDDKIVVITQFEGSMVKFDLDDIPNWESREFLNIQDFSRLNYMPFGMLTNSSEDIIIVGQIQPDHYLTWLLRVSPESFVCGTDQCLSSLSTNILSPAQTFFGSTSGLANNIENYSCVSERSFKGPEIVYQFEKPDNAKLDLLLFSNPNFSTSNKDLDLFLFDECSNSSPQPCIGESIGQRRFIDSQGSRFYSTLEQISKTNLDEGTYYVCIDGKSNSDEGDFYLGLSLGFDCSDAIPLVCGEKTSGSNAEASHRTNFYFDPSRSNFHLSKSAGEVLYKFTVDGVSSKNVTIEMSNYARGLEFFLLQSCDVKSVIIKGGLLSKYTQNLEPGTYYLAIDGADGKTSSYDIMVSWDCDTCTEPDGTTILVNNTNDEGEGSLRSAIECANTTAGANTILIDLPIGQNTIQVGSTTGLALPAITDDQTSIVNSRFPNHYVVLDGSNSELSSESSGLRFEGAQFCRVEGLTIENFPANGIYASNSQGLWVGADTSASASNFGNVIRFNGDDDLGNGIFLSGSPNSIIGKNAINGNYLSGTYLLNSSNTEFINNTVYSNTAGLWLNNTDGSEIRGNNIYENNKEGSLISIDLSLRTYAKNSGVVLHGGSSNNLLKTNQIHTQGNHGILIYDNSTRNTITRNELYCNQGFLSEVSQAILLQSSNGSLPNNGIAPPIIQLATLQGIKGTGNQGDIIELFLDIPVEAPIFFLKSNQTLLCPGAPCQGNFYLGSTTVNEEGKWVFLPSDLPEGVNLKLGDVVTATATNELGSTSEFASCEVVRINETVCDLGGLPVDRQIRYDGSLVPGELAPNAIRGVDQVIDFYNQNIPENLLGDIYIFENLDTGFFFFSLPSEVVAFAFTCDCVDVPDGGIFCSQNYLGNSRDDTFGNEEEGFPSGFYYIIVVSEVPTEYTFSISPGGPCKKTDDPQPLLCGDFLDNLDLQGSQNFYQRDSESDRDIYSNAGYDGERSYFGEDAQFLLTVDSRSDYTFTFKANDNLGLFLYDVECGSKILDFRETSVFENEVSFTQLLDEGKYTLIVDSEEGVSDGNFSLSVFCGAPVLAFARFSDICLDYDANITHEVRFVGTENSVVSGINLSDEIQNAKIYMEYLNHEGVLTPVPSQISGVSGQIVCNQDNLNIPLTKCGYAPGDTFNIKVQIGNVHYPVRGRFISGQSTNAIDTFQAAGISLVDSLSLNDFEKRSFLITPQVSSIRPEGDTLALAIKSSVSWDVTIPSHINWIDVFNGRGRKGNGNFTLGVKKYDGAALREDTIYIDWKGFRTPLIIRQRSACSLPQMSILSNNPVIPCNVTSIPISAFASRTNGMDFTWSDESGNILSKTLTFDASRAGIYTLKVEQINNSNCFDILTVNVGKEPDLSIDVIDNQDISCFGQNDGSITLQVSGGTGNKVISWDDDNNIENLIRNSLPPNTYRAFVRDDNNCIASTGPITILEPSILEAIEETVDASGPGFKDGIAEIIPVGGSPSYKILWSNQSTENPQTGLEAGTYAYILTDANQCTYEGEVEIKNQCVPATITLLNDITNIPCNEESLNVSVDVDTRFSNLAYTWEDEQENVLSESLNVKIDQPGNYTFTANYPDGSCPSTQVVSIQKSPDLNLTFTKEDVSCYGESSGSITLEEQGGTAPFDFDWSNTAQNARINSSLSKGSYSATITDATGCQDSVKVNIEEPLLLSAIEDSVDVSMPGQTDGMAIVTPQGGVGPYTVMWNTQFEGDTLKNVGPGTYSYIFTDANQCSISGEILIGAVCAPPQIALVESSPLIKCNEESTEIQPIISSMTGTESYYWINQSNDTISKDLNLQVDSAGIYIFILDLGDNCTTSRTVNVEFQENLSLSVRRVDHVSCYGENDGLILLDSEGGVGNPSFQWSANVTGQSGNLIARLAPDTYSVTATDNGGCTDSLEIEITEPEAITIDAQIDNASGPGKEDGAVFLSIAGGVPPYTVDWSNNTIGDSLKNVGKGIYEYVITDNTGCIFEGNVEIKENCAFNVMKTVTPASCLDNADGALAISIDNDTVEIEVVWPDGFTGSSRSALLPDTYPLEIKSSQGCSLLEEVFVSFLDVIPPVKKDTVLSLYLTDKGTVDLTEEMLQPLVSDNCGIESLSTNRNIFDCNDLGLQKVAFSVSDFNDNVLSDTLLIEVMDTIKPIFESCPQNIITTECSVNFEILTTDNCGTPTISYTEGFQSGATFPVGTTPVTITAKDDAKNFSECSFTVTVESDLLIDGLDIDPICYDGDFGSAVVNATGGTPPYTYYWNNEVGTNTFTTDLEEELILKVKDGMDCEFIQLIDIPASAPIEISIVDTNLHITGEDLGVVNLSVQGGTPPLNYQWNAADPDANFTAEDTLIKDLEQGQYWLVVTDSLGCNAISDTFNVSELTNAYEIIAELEELAVYPNPANQSIQVEIKASKAYEMGLLIQNSLGQVVFYLPPERQSHLIKQINTNHFPDGLYVVKFLVDEISIPKKLIIHRP